MTWIGAVPFLGVVLVVVSAHDLQHLAAVQRNVSSLQQAQHDALDRLHIEQDKWQHEKDLNTWLIRARDNLQARLLVMNNTRARVQDSALRLERRNTELRPWIDELENKLAEHENTRRHLEYDQLALQNSVENLNTNNNILTQQIQAVQSEIDDSAAVLAAERSSWDKYGALLVPRKSSKESLMEDEREQRVVQQGLNLHNDALQHGIHQYETEKQLELTAKALQTQRNDALVARYSVLAGLAASAEQIRSTRMTTLQAAQVENVKLVAEKSRLEAEKARLSEEYQTAAAGASDMNQQRSALDQTLNVLRPALEAAMQAREQVQQNSNDLVSAATELKYEDCLAKNARIKQENSHLQQNIQLITEHGD